MARLQEDWQASEADEKLLQIISKLFNPTGSKFILQVGLTSLARNLADIPELVPVYVSVLLAQPQAMRQRLLRPAAAGQGPNRLAYVMGPTSRLYEERCIAEQFPRLEVAKATLATIERSEMEHLELEHCDVLAACCTGGFEDALDDWTAFFETIKAYVCVALVDPNVQASARQVAEAFFIGAIGPACIEAAKPTLLQALEILYGNVEREKVDESEMYDFLVTIIDAGPERARAIEFVIQSLKKEHPDEFSRSSLGKLLRA